MEVFDLSLKIREEGAASVESAMSKLNKAALLAGAAIGTGLVLALRKLVDATSEAQFAQAQLAAAIRSTDGVAGQSIDTLNEHAAALQRVTAYGDDTVNAAQGLLLTFTQIQGDTFPKATEAVLDVATAMGTDLKSAAIQVGKALNDPILGVTALARSGIQFSVAQKATIKALVETNQQAEAQALILRELERQFGGSAKAARETLGGAIAALKENFSDLFELSTENTKTLVAVMDGLGRVIQDINAHANSLTASMQLVVVAFVGAKIAAVAFGGASVIAFAPIAAALAAVLLGFTNYLDKQNQAIDASERASQTNKEYQAVLEQLRERRAAATKAEEEAAAAAAAAAEEANSRIENLVELAGLTDLTTSQLTELLAAEQQYRNALNDANLPLSQRNELLKQQKELLDALATGRLVGERAGEERMAAAAGGATTTAVEGLGAATAGLPAVMNASARMQISIAQAGARAREALQQEAHALALDIQQAFGDAFASGITDGLAAGLAAAIASGRIADAWQAMGQAIVQNMASAMVQVALAALKMSTLLERIRAFMIANPAAAIAASAALLAVAYANGGKAQGGKTQVTGGIGGATITPMATGENTVTRLLFGATSATSAAGMSPRTATNVTIIGPDDPKAQRAIQELINKGATRGTL